MKYIRVIEGFPRILVGQWVDVEGHYDAWDSPPLAPVPGGVFHGSGAAGEARVVLFDLCVKRWLCGPLRLGPELPGHLGGGKMPVWFGSWIERDGDGDSFGLFYFRNVLFYWM